MYKLIILVCICVSIVSKGLGQPVRVNAIIVDSSFDAASLAKLQQACALLDSVFNSQGFEDSVKKEKFNRFSKGKSSAEILEIIQSGMDYYEDKPKDYSIDLRVSLYDKYEGGSEYGRTDMNTRVTSTHRCYVLHNDVKCYVSHLVHEYLHQIGFVDSKHLWQKKTGSVPYLIGDIVDKIIRTPGVCPAQKGTCKK